MKSILTAGCLWLCLTLSSCSKPEYAPVILPVYPPEQLYAPKPPPLPPVGMGQTMSPRQLAGWLSRYITWGSEMCADRAALEAWQQGMEETGMSETYLEQGS